MTRLFVAFYPFRKKGIKQSAFGGKRLIRRSIYNQEVFPFSHYGAVTGPGVIIEFFEILYQFYSQGVEVDVADKLQQVRVFFTYNRFVAILKKMPTSSMTNVECYCISGHETSHDFAEWGGACA